MREAAAALGVGLDGLRRLHPLPYMLERGRLARIYPPAVRERVKSWCTIIAPIMEAPSETTRQELLVIEGVHTGEVELFGLLFDNPEYSLLTGDRVAMRALRDSESLHGIYANLCGRVACTEQVMLLLLQRLGVRVVADAVSPLRPYNGMLNAVFSMGTDSTLEHCLEGLTSYAQDLAREVGPTFLRNFDSK